MAERSFERTAPSLSLSPLSTNATMFRTVATNAFRHLESPRNIHRDYHCLSLPPATYTHVCARKLPLPLIRKLSLLVAARQREILWTSLRLLLRAAISRPPSSLLNSKDSKVSIDKYRVECSFLPFLLLLFNDYNFSFNRLKSSKWDVPISRLKFVSLESKDARGKK